MGLGVPGCGVRALDLGSRGAVVVNRRTGLWWGDGKRTQLVQTPGRNGRSEAVSLLGKSFGGLPP